MTQTPIDPALHESCSCSTHLYLCMMCRQTSEVSVGDLSSSCPICHATMIPALVGTEFPITLTSHEWRTLFIWAEFWAASCNNTHNDDRMLRMLYGILDEVMPQLPYPLALSFSQELADLRVANPNSIVATNFPDPPITERYQ